MQHCIIYFSHSTRFRQETDLLHLLEQSRQHNAAADITGILLFVQGSIVQVLEGEESVIEALFEKIDKDPRHTNVAKVVSQPIEKRHFTDWSMGYKTISRAQLDIIKSIIDLGDTDWLTTKPSSNILINMLKVYFENSIYNY